MLPLSPPIQTADLPKIGGTIGTEPEDFRVDEIPLYAASGEGEHLYVRLRKRELTTPDLLRLLSRATRIKERDIGCAGMKDKHAVTSQWLSFPTGCPDPSTWVLPAGVEILEQTRHGNKLRTGHLFGNRFKVRLVGVEEASLEPALRIADSLKLTGLANFFGAQRFGIQGRNLRAAFDAFAHQHTHAESERAANKRGGSRRFYAKFNPSVIQSEIFNRYLPRRLALGAHQIFAGETVRLEGSPKTFIVEDEAAEQIRLKAGGLHLTGPIFGSSSRVPAGVPGELLLATLEELQLTLDHIQSFGRDARGSVRDLIVPLDDLTLTPDSAGLVLEFTLPAGSYATQLIREFTGHPFVGGQRVEQAAVASEQPNGEL